MKILWSWKYKQDKKVISSRQVLYVTVPGGKTLTTPAEIPLDPS